MVNDPELQAALLEEAMREVKSGNTELVAELLHNLGEVGVQGKMSQAYAVNPDRDDSYITIYSTLNGVASTILKTMAPKTLSKRLPNDTTVPVHLRNKPAFSMTPTMTIPEPTYLCILHPDNPMRDWLDANGLVGIVCHKKLASAFSQRRHRETRHKLEDSQIKDLQQAELDKENREYQRATVELLRAQTEVAKRGRNAT